MDDAGVQAFRRITVKFSFVQLVKKDLAGGTGLIRNHVGAAVTGIGHVMVQAQAFVRLVQVMFKITQTLDIAAVQADAELIAFTVNLVADCIITLQITEFRG